MSDNKDIVVSKPETSLVLSKEHIGSVMANIDMLTEGFKEWMREGLDYTKELYGRGNKPSLLDTGTFKMINFFQVRPRHRVLVEVSETEKGAERIKYVVAAELVNPKTGWVVAEGVGSCSTDEIKYQYRWFWSTKLREMGVTDEERASLPTRTRNNAPQWRIRNPDILDLDNTIMKMAAKRAEMDGALQLPGVSAVFTQDLGDPTSPVTKHVQSEQKPVASEQRPVGDGFDFKDELKNRGFDVSNLEFVDKDVGWRVNAIEWLGDTWAPLNNAIRELGGEWIRNEENKKENHWWIPKPSGERTPVRAPPPQGAGQTPRREEVKEMARRDREQREARQEGAEHVIKQILKLNPNLTREAVERLIDEERAKAAGLLTEEAAAYIVANNLGLPTEKDPEPEEPNPDIIPGSTPLGDFSKPQEAGGGMSLDEIIYKFQDKIPDFEKLMNVSETSDGFMIDQARLVDDEINVKVNSMVRQMGGEHLKRGGPYGLGWFIPKK